MQTRYARFVSAAAGAALLPYGLVTFFTWLRDGQPAGVVALLGDGDLLPTIALLAAHALAASHAIPAHSRNLAWIYRANAARTLFAFACVGHALPYTDASGFESRLAWTSIAMFAVAVAITPRSTADGVGE